MRIHGTGLGMAITKNIVDMMGGTIKVQTAQGKVEDNELNREIAPEILREYGFRVDTAEN